MASSLSNLVNNHPEGIAKAYMKNVIIKDNS